jgi:photosystem II stability/assembly factor-like uncharacterized protein
MMRPSTADPVFIRRALLAGAVLLVAATAAYSAAVHTENVVESYPTYADAMRGGARERGWLPDFVPTTATAIREVHNLDSGEQWLRFALPPAELDALATRFRPVSPYQAGSHRRPPRWSGRWVREAGMPCPVIRRLDGMGGSGALCWTAAIPPCTGGRAAAPVPDPGLSRRGAPAVPAFSSARRRPSVFQGPGMKLLPSVLLALLLPACRRAQNGIPDPARVAGQPLARHRMRVPILLASAALALAACQPGADQPFGRGPVPAATTEVEIGPDSLFRATRARLVQLGYRLDQVDSDSRIMLVRPPDAEGRVVVRIEGRGGSSRITTAAAEGGDSVQQLAALLTVMHDVAMEPAGQRTDPGDAPGPLPDSRWITEFFVSPSGRLWSARGGLFTADSLFGPWRRSFGGPGDPVDADKLIMDASMGFVSEQVMLAGVQGEGWRNSPLLFRTADGGSSWSPVPGALFEDVDAIVAAGPSVWVFATQRVGEAPRAVLMRSGDGGASWERAALPAGMENVTHAYRATADTAYVAMAGFNPGPVFWRTTDGGGTWAPIPTPHDQKLHRVPEGGVHIQEIATVGDQLVVVEYGRVFATRTDSIRWRAMNEIEHVAADRATDHLFALTTRLEPVMMDSALSVVWRGDQRITDYGTSNSVTGIVAHDGVGYVVMQRGEMYEVRGGRVRLRTEGR